MTTLLGRHGLVLLDPLDQRLKSLAAPLYARAALRAHEIASAIELRSQRLVEARFAFVNHKAGCKVCVSDRVPASVGVAKS